MSTKEKVRERVREKEATGFNNEIIVYNDDVNTFDHVIDTLMRVCSHTPEQAEQCSLIVHYNGKCTVKTGQVKTTMHTTFRSRIKRRNCLSVNNLKKILFYSIFE